MGTIRIQCMLFVQQSSDDDNSAAESYALLPPEFLDHPACQIFTKNNIQVISNLRVKINRNLNFLVIETFLNQLSVTYPPKHVCLYVSHHKSIFVQRLFNKCFIKLATNFRQTKICSAVIGKNLRVIEKFLTAGASLTYKGNFYGDGTLLHFAAEKGNEALLKLLLKHGALVDAKTEWALTSLHVALLKDNLNVVKLLLNEGADIECSDDDGNTPLHTAVYYYCDLKAIQLLVESGANLEARRNDGFTPFHVAACYSKREVLEYLLRRGANPNSTVDSNSNLKGATPLHLAVKEKRLEIAEFLIENGASINARCSNGRSVLYFAVDGGHIETVESLLTHRPKVNDMGNQKAFQLAFRKTTKQSEMVVKKMLECGFNIGRKHAKEPDFLFGAIRQNMLEIVKKLLDCGADIDQFHTFASLKLSPLHLAVQYSDTPVIQLLLKRGANVNAERGRTNPKRRPLLDAIGRCDVAVVKLLLSYGANINLDHPNTLLFAVRSPSDPQVVELLLAYGADVNAVSTDRETPLSVGLKEGSLGVIELLIKFGARFSFEDIAGETAKNALALQAVLDFIFVPLKPVDETEIRELFSLYDWWTEGGSEGKFFTYGDCAKILAHHILKIDAAHESVDPREVIPTTLFELFDLNDFQSRCKTEISRMKNAKIGRTSVTFYDILTKGVDEISRFSRNKDFEKKFELYDTEGKFPTYGSILKCHFRQGTLRRKLMRTAITMLKSLFSQFTMLPDEIKEKTIDFLSNQDILILKKCLNLE